jgi:hypothetical protein
VVKAPDAVPKQGRGPLPLPWERARNTSLAFSRGEKVADGGGQMRGFLPKGKGERPGSKKSLPKKQEATTLVNRGTEKNGQA